MRKTISGAAILILVSFIVINCAIEAFTYQFQILSSSLVSDPSAVYEFTASIKQGELVYIEIPATIRSQLPALATFLEKPHTTLGDRTSDSLEEVGLRLNPSTGTIFGRPSKPGDFKFLIAVAQPDTGQEIAYIWVLVTITSSHVPPIAKPGGPYQGRVGQEITFDGTGSEDPDGQIVDYSWDFGDGNTAKGAKVTHAYSTPGVYAVCLTVTDNDGLVNKECTTAEIHQEPSSAPQLPVARFTFQPVNPDPGALVTFDASESYDPDGGSITLYQWDFGDGSPKSQGMTARHAFAISGIYQVTLTVTDDDNQTASVTKSICVGLVTLPFVRLESGVPVEGKAEHAGLSATQYTFEVLEGTKVLLVRLRGRGDANLDLFVRHGRAIEVLDGEIQADFAATAPWQLESVSIINPQPGTYYIAVENMSAVPQDFTLLAAVVPVLEILNPGIVMKGEIDPAQVGSSKLGLIQYILDVPEGSRRLEVTLENLGVGKLNLHIRYNQPVEVSEGRILASYSSTTGLGQEKIILLGSQLKPGRYYIAIENLEPYPQHFTLVAKIGQGRSEMSGCLQT